MSEDSNIGLVGPESIRIAGRKIENLPIAEGARAKQQMGAVIENDRLNKIATVNATYPTQRLDYLLSRINECRENITRVNKTIDEQNNMISEYRGHISMCKHRDKEIARIEKTGAHQTNEGKAQIKSLRSVFPPYNVDAMEQQIVQCKEAIVRCNDVIAQENTSIGEFQVVVSKVKERDIKLANLGALAEGS